MKKTHSSKEVISMLIEQGAVLLKDRGKGSHSVLKLTDGRIVTVPHSKEQPIGTQKSIERATGVNFTHES